MSETYASPSKSGGGPSSAKTGSDPTTAKTKLDEVGQAVRSVAASAAENVRSGADQALEHVQGALSSVAAEGKRAGTYLSEQAGHATESLGGQLRTAGEGLRRHAPQDGRLAQATAAVADTLDSAGQYLQEEGLEGMSKDITNLIRRNPIPAICVGVAVGFLLSRATSPRN